jgi:hypothetical protein
VSGWPDAGEVTGQLPCLVQFTPPGPYWSFNLRMNVKPAVGASSENLHLIISTVEGGWDVFVSEARPGPSPEGRVTDGSSCSTAPMTPGGRCVRAPRAWLGANSEKHAEEAP